MMNMQNSVDDNTNEFFSVFDVDGVTARRNIMVDAIYFILRYTGRTNSESAQKELEHSGETLDYISYAPYNNLVSTTINAVNYHKRLTRGKRDAFSSFSTEQIIAAVEKYEQEFSSRKQSVAMLSWSFQTDVLLAFDKFYKEVKQFHKKYKNVVGLREMMADVDKFIQNTLDVIGAPENTWFDGPIGIYQIFEVRDKLSQLNKPIFPIHIYYDILRFQEVKEFVLQKKREHSRKTHYDSMSNSLDKISDKNIELATANHDMAQHIKALETENKKLRTENGDLRAKNAQFALQIANMRQSVIGNLLFKMAQKRK